ncbi:hypothetical protein [Algibacter sp. L3A6]|uniref:hypothetical protein n=1 Tax=Algibacter sp. L3A6 TaxID=2686366 RepID=UPI00131EC5BC|nr:hypothetical protein [Algibacter sp. L3A6]
MKTPISLLLLFLVTIVLTGCNDNLKNYEFIELNEDDISNFETKKDSLKFIELGKGSTWKMWKDLHKECMKNQWLNKSRYFGVSNTLKLGTITDRHFKEVYNTLDGLLTQNEMDYVIDEGAAQTCDYIRKVSFDFESELDVNVKGQNQELSLFIDNSTNTNVQINGWQQQNLNTDRLVQVMEADSAKNNKNKQLYAKRLKEENNRLLSTVVKINGFTSIIQSSKKISTDLKLKLDEGLINASIGNTGINVNFTYVDSLTIKTTTNTSFYVFGRYLKTKKL